MLTFQFSALAVYLVILVCWFVPKKLNNKKSVVFVCLLLCVGVTIIMDLLSSHVSNYQSVSKITNNVLFKVFLISLIITAYFEFAYLVDKAIERKLKEKVAQFSIIVPLISIILISLLPIEVTKLENGFNVVGPSIDCAYISSIVFFLMIIAVFVFSKNRINKWYRMCFVVSAFTWISAAVIQFFTTRTGVLSIAFVCSILVIFIFIENPLNYINHEYGCFKNNFMYFYIDSLIKSGKNGLAIFVDINWTKENENSAKIQTVIKHFIEAFDSYKDVRVFIDENNNIYIVSAIGENYKKYKVLVDRLIDENYNSIQEKSFFRAEAVFCNNIRLFNYADEFVSFVKASQEKLLKISGYYAVHEITTEEVEKERKDEAVKGEIIRALDENRVEAFVQPIYSVKKGKIVSAEALSRIRNSDGTLMLPYQFIPISETCGLDIKIGYRMIERICQYLIDPILGNLFEYVDINLSIAQCEMVDLAKRIINITQKYNINPNRINFEITESGFINKLNNIERNIRLLTEYGFGFSLDDFGSGESNLDYLVEMPVTYLKLDMHMIWAYFENERAKKTVQSIIKISHDMGLEVIAEGVETKEQLDELSQQGVDFVQGYYFYKPMTINEYLQIVNSKKDNNQE